MANITFSSPVMHKDVTVYAVAGDTKTLLALAEKHGVKIPFECRDGECGSCLVEVEYTGNNPPIAIALTEKEKATLKSLGKLSAKEQAEAEVNDRAPHYRLACQFIARDEDVTVRFTGTPGGAG